MSSNPHILIIRLSAMGDVAMTVPVIQAFVNQHPNCKITVLSKPFLEPLFESIPNVSFFAADVKKRHKGFLGIYRLFRELKKLKITHVADLHNVLRSQLLRRFFSFTQVKIAQIDKGRAEKKALIREHDKIFKQLKTSHQRYADVLKDLGFPVDIYNIPTLTKIKKMPQKISDLLKENTKPLIGIAPFAAFEHKMYPMHLMRKVISELSNYGEILLFGGGEKEISILNQIEKENDNVISIAGKMNFKEELQVIANLDVMLSMDSGNAHLAAMKEIKTVTLWGVTHPYAGFAPFNQPSDFCILPDLEQYPKIPCSVYGNKIFNGYDNVMETIEPNAVVDKIREILKN